MTPGYLFLMTIILACSFAGFYAGANGKSDDAAGFSVASAALAFLAIVIWSLPSA